MPAFPYLGSDRNQGMVRLRLRLSSAKAWAAYDYVYRWEPAAAVAGGASGPGSPRTGLLGGAETPCRAREASGKEWPCSVRITAVRADGGVAGEMTWTSLGSVHRPKGTLRGSTLTFTETEAIRPGNATLGTTDTVTLSGAGGSGTYSDPVAQQSGTIEIGRP